MSQTIRVGLTGCGYIGAEQARIVNDMPTAELVAVHSASGAGASRVAAELGCEVAADLTSLLSHREIDAIIVATPNHLHREPVVAAARAGKHVFCEKPFALSTEECDEMISACRDSGVTLMLGHMMHFYAGMRRVKRWIDDGLIGRPLVVHAARTGWEHPRPTVSWKKQQASSGGHLFHHIHEIDLLQWLVGPITKVHTVGGNLAHRGAGYGDEDDILLLNLEFADGGVGSMQYGSGFRWGEHMVKISGTEGAILIDSQRASVVVRGPDSTLEETPLFDDPRSQESMLELFRRTDGGSAYGSPTDRPPHYLQQAVRDELETFVSVIAGAPAPDEMRMLFDGSAARQSVAVASAALASLRGGVPADVAVSA